MAAYGALASTASSLLQKKSSSGGGGTALSKIVNPFIKKGLSGKQRVQRVFDPFGFFGGGDDEEEIQARPDYPYMAAENLYNWSTDYSNQYPYDPAKPYEGLLSAGMTPTETGTQGMLSKYLSSPSSTTLPAAENYTTNVLEGGYDPRTSPYYTSMKEQIMKDSQEAQDAILHESARSGQLHSDPRRIQERKLAETTSQSLSNLIGGLYETERGRMGEAARMAPELAKTAESIPIQRIAAGATVGAIPRQVKQQDYDRHLTEYMRQVEGARQPYAIQQGLAGQNYDPYDAQPYLPGQNTGGSSGGGGLDLSTILSLVQMLGKK